MKATIYSNDFNRLIETTKKFTCDYANRPLHRHIRLEFDAEQSMVTAIAVDGYRMSVEHAVCECDESFCCYIRGSVKLPKELNAHLEVVGDEVIIRCDGFTFGYAQPQGEFLDWRKALPGDPTFRIAFNGNYLLSALQAAKTSAGNSFKKPIILEFRGPVDPVIIRTNKEDIKMVLPMRIKE